MADVHSRSFAPFDPRAMRSARQRRADLGKRTVRRGRRTVRPQASVQAEGEAHLARVIGQSTGERDGGGVERPRRCRM